MQVFLFEKYKLRNSMFIILICFMKIFLKILSVLLMFCLFNNHSFADKLPYHYKWYKWPNDLINYKKSIVIDTYSWSLTAYFHWQQIWNFPASVWNRNWPTPKWRFKIVAKMDIVQSKTNGLLMPYWMEFYWNGKYGIHALPLYKDWVPKYEQNAVYKKLWWGCVRLRNEDVETLYRWTDTGTTVIII